MASLTNIALMTPDPSVAAAVSAALQSNGHVVAAPAIRDVRDLPAQLSRVPVPIVLVDLDPHPHQVLPHLERLVAKFPTTRFVALASTLGNELLVEAMQTGVRRVVVKQTMSSELRGVLDRLTPAASAETGCDVFTILSASGGCGATTLAVNLAEELALEQKKPTLVLDLDCAYGAVSSYLGLNPQYAIDHVLSHSAPADPDLIRSTATLHNERLHVLASPCSTDFNRTDVTPFDGLEQVIRASREAYANTVVDAPRISIASAATLASGSSVTLLVFQLTVKDLRTARAMLDALKQRGVDTDAVRLVANRFVKRQMVGLDDARKALGGAEILQVRNDYTPAIRGLNYGQLLSEAGPRSTLRKDLQDLLAAVRSKAPAGVK
jgi:pilus assembly protein CpaE